MELHGSNLYVKSNFEFTHLIPKRVDPSATQSPGTFPGPIPKITFFGYAPQFNVPRVFFFFCWSVDFSSSPRLAKSVIMQGWYTQTKSENIHGEVLTLLGRRVRMMNELRISYLINDAFHNRRHCCWLATPGVGLCRAINIFNSGLRKRQVLPAVKFEKMTFVCLFIQFVWHANT